MTLGANLRDRFDQLQAREQKLLLAFLGVIALMIVVLVPIALAATAASHRKDNDAIREVLTAIGDARPALEREDANRRHILARYARPAPPLAGFLEQLATIHHIEIPESQDQPVIPHAS